ncbi:MAG: hypothetical protein WCK67_00455 [bacterium]
MINGINSSINSSVISNIYDSKQQTKTPEVSSLTNFDIEDKAIISAEAKMLNESDKYNSGQGNEIDLAISQIEAKTQTAAEVNVINTKKEMIDSVLEIGK